MVRGELRIEKFGGVRLLSTEGMVSTGSQVSERDSTSSLWSDIASWREVGLSRWGVTLPSVTVLVSDTALIVIVTSAVTVICK